MWNLDLLLDLTPVHPSCPCPPQRHLQSAGGVVVWEVVYTAVILVLMFAALVTDKFGPDSVMLAVNTLYMAAGIITIPEGLVGFSNAGLLTVLMLFVIAEGINKTGALDWYISRLLGRPKTSASAQLRLMAPITVVSAFLNNTPIVTVMIPIVQKWARNVNISVKQLLIPLSYASIFGGTCTLIGTSTNLVVAGLLAERYPNDADVYISLIALGQYGVPVALIGMAYVLLISPFLLPGATGRSQINAPDNDDEDILLGARLTPWSPAAGRFVQRSGLRDSGGIYLVSVQRAATGHIHRAVSHDFILQPGDILYFTGLVETFGSFCADNGLEVITNENQDVAPIVDSTPELGSRKPLLAGDSEDKTAELSEVPLEIGCDKATLLESDEKERLRSISRMADLIRGYVPPEEEYEAVSSPIRRDRVDPTGVDPPNIVVSIDKELVVVGINCSDRPGLLLDISKALLRLELELRHTEAAVVGDRSLSIWRCEASDPDQTPDLEQVWSVLHSLLSKDTRIEVAKRRGLRVIRARVTKDSRLVGKTASEVEFRATYQAAIVAIHSQGRYTNSALSEFRFSPGDELILQASEESPLLRERPTDTAPSTGDRPSRASSLVKIITRRSGGLDASTLAASSVSFPVTNAQGDVERGSTVDNGGDIANEHVAAWRDLEVISGTSDVDDQGPREFLTAMVVGKDANWIGKNAREVGLTKLPDLVLVSIERTHSEREETKTQGWVNRFAVTFGSGDDSVAATSTHNETRVFTSLDPDAPLQAGDVLWFSGTASSVGDLRKIPGLISFVSKQVQKMNEKAHDRRLVQAVVARQSPLVGKTPKEGRFRTRYGAAVIAVHREGKRVHELPGNVKLQAGDVLLLEAGTSFLQGLDPTIKRLLLYPK